jgi:hypothetical protein
MIGFTRSNLTAASIGFEGWGRSPPRRSCNSSSPREKAARWTECANFSRTRERLLRNLRKAQVLKALYFTNPLNVLIDIDVSADSELIGGFEPCNGGM